MERNLRTAVRAAIVWVLLGGALFQASSVGFEYMKLRKLPLYASAASLRGFSQTVFELTHQMDERTRRIRDLIGDRATIDIELAERSEAARISIVAARTFLRYNLTAAQVRASGFDTAPVTFTATEGLFQAYCSPKANTSVGIIAAELPDAPTASTPAVTPAKGVPTGPPGGPLAGQQAAAFEKACASSRPDCPRDAPGDPLEVRPAMICAQTALQSTLKRREAILAFKYDPAVYLADVLKLTYPGITPDDIDGVVKTTEGYRALVGQPASTSSPQTADGRASWLAPFAGAYAACLVGFWGFLLSLPLALLYLALSFTFGALGSVSNYLYATAAPDEVAKTPVANPWFTILAGGGAAILAVLIIMAGFQFLTVGASTPDLAYPNPLTVCGLSVIVGLQGDRVLAALKTWTGRFLARDGAPPRGG